MRQVLARTAVRTTAVMATTSLAIGLLGPLAPPGQASASGRSAGPAPAVRIPIGLSTLHLPASAARPVSKRRPVPASPATEAITGLMKALGGEPLTGIKLPPLIKWRLSQFRPGSNRPVADQASASTGSITGAVTGDGHPLAGICVAAESKKRPSEFKITTTAKTGHYRLSGLAAGRYNVTFLADVEPRCPNRGNWLEQWYRGIDAAGPRKAATVAVRANKVTKGINASLHHGAEITGTVRDTAGQPISGICAITFSFSGDSATVAESKSGKNGHYTLGGLFPGKYQAYFLIGCGTKGNYAFQLWRHAKSSYIKVAARQIVTGIDPVMLPGATVTGTVRAGNPSGKPVAGACLVVVGRTDLPSQEKTGRAGRFEVKGLQGGLHVLAIDPTCQGSKISPLLDVVRKLHLAGGRVDRLGSIPLRVGARLTGVVRDSSGHPLSGVCVDVEDFEADDPAGPATTGPSGTYSVVGISPGKFPVRFSGCATAHAVAAQFYNDQPTEDSANQVRFRAGQTVSGIDATMRPAGALTGIVTDRSGHPVRNVCVGIVTASASDNTDSGFQSTVRTKANGRYLLRNVVPGPYQVSIGCYGSQFAGRWFNNQQDSAQGGFLSISPGVVTTLNGVVGQPGAISGNVTDQAGKPVSNVCVFIVDPKTRTYINRGGGDFPGDGPPLPHRGHFQIRGLTPGRYLVDFVSSCAGGKFADRWYHNGVTPATTRLVTVRPGQLTTGINQVMVQGGSISGVITGPTGQPAKNTCVQAFDKASLGYGFATTSKTGHYTMNGLDTGRYLVYAGPCTVHGPNLGAVAAPGLVKVTRPRTTTVNFKLKAGGTIAGRVLGATGKNPQAGTCVLAVSVNPDGSQQSVMTKRDGSYLLPQLTPGKYRIYFGDLYCIDFNDLVDQREATTAPQWFQNRASESSATTITVTSGHTNTGINATMHPYGTISGTVRTQSKRPVSEECVTAVPTVPQFDQALDQPIPDVSAITATNGRYTLIALPGQYKIEFSTGCGASGFATQWWKGASSAKTAQLITVAYGTTTGIDATLHH